MATAFGWGVLAASSLVIGGLIAVHYRVSRRALGLIMAFGSGVLISAVAFDLVLEAHAIAAESGGVALGLFLGCGTFFTGDAIIDRLGGSGRKDIDRQDESGAAIVLGIVLE